VKFSKHWRDMLYLPWYSITRASVFCTCWSLSQFEVNIHNVMLRTSIRLLCIMMWVSASIALLLQNKSNYLLRLPVVWRRDAEECLTAKRLPQLYHRHPTQRHGVTTIQTHQIYHLQDNYGVTRIQTCLQNEPICQYSVLTHMFIVHINVGI